MAGNADANLHFQIKKGFCGQAFLGCLHKVHFIDLTQISKKKAAKQFNFSDGELEMTTHIKAIACIPLYTEVKTIRGHPNTKFFGVLNVDTTELKAIEFLRSPQIQKQIAGLAGYTQLILG